MVSWSLSARLMFFAFLASSASAQSSAAWKDPSPHATQFVTVDKDVALEVLDWGGSGRPLVLLAGGGNTAHIFDDFAPKLTAFGHVYGITRRGFGASGFGDGPADVERLGADVVAVLEALKLQRPVLIGHSFGGAELSAVANSHPEKIAGLVYLDAAYSYAYDDGKGASVKELQGLHAPQPPGPSEADEASFPALQEYYARVNGFRFPEAELRAQRESTASGGVGKPRNPPGGAMLSSLIQNGKKFTAIPAPALVVFANPHGFGRWVEENPDPKVQSAARAFSATMNGLVERQENAVRNGVPTARVITLPGANHYVFLSNEADVLRAMGAFLKRLP
ncbi:alpha/beta hydrolase [Acidobacteria bacterium AB60]|nr:alpha/beta hydrolase [Acidobacteria bacterium AB60]